MWLKVRPRVLRPCGCGQISFGLECMAWVIIILLRLGHFQHLTNFNCLYFLSILIFIYVLNPQWVIATYSRNGFSSAKVSCREHVRYRLRLAAIRCHAGFYANCAVPSHTCIA